MTCAADPDRDSRPCQLCGTRGLTRFHIPGRTTLYLCGPCELYQYGVGVERDHYEEGYHSEYHRDLPRKRRTARLRLNRIASLLAAAEEPVRLLDVGSSVGAVLEAAGERGWDATGVDVSGVAVEECQRRGLDAVTISGVALPFADKTFDVVCAWHVIEHVDDVRETLEEWTRVLRPGGVLAIETPDAACPKIRRLGAGYPKFWKEGHTYTYTRSNLTRFFTAAGLEIVPAPALGNLASLGVAMASYGVGRQAVATLRSTLGIATAFQLFGRRPLVASATAPAAGRRSAA